MVAGLAGRAVVQQEVAFLALSLVATAGMAMANVLIPSLVRLHFPDRIGLLTGLYTTALAFGLTASFLLTVPVADAFGTGATGSASGRRSRPSRRCRGSSCWGTTGGPPSSSTPRCATSASATSPAPGWVGR